MTNNVPRPFIIIILLFYNYAPQQPQTNSNVLFLIYQIHEGDGRLRDGFAVSRRVFIHDGNAIPQLCNYLTTDFKQCLQQWTHCFSI